MIAACDSARVSQQSGFPYLIGNGRPDQARASGQIKLQRGASARSGRSFTLDRWIAALGQLPDATRTSLRGSSGQPLAIFVIPRVQETGATFRKPSITDCVFECVALAVHCPGAMIHDCEKAKLAAA
jgi:hypothetical protein